MNTYTSLHLKSEDRVEMLARMPSPCLDLAGDAAIHFCDATKVREVRDVLDAYLKSVEEADLSESAGVEGREAWEDALWTYPPPRDDEERAVA